MFKYLKDKKLGVSFSLLFSILGNLALVITPFYLGNAIDAMVSKSNVDFTLVKTYLLNALLLYILSFIFVWISNYISFLISATVVSDIREKIQDKLSRLSLSYLDTNAHGRLVNMVSNDSDLVLDGLFQLLSQILGGIVIIVVATLFMLSISITMTLVVYLTIPFVYISSSLVSKASNQAFKEQQRLAGLLNGFVQENIHTHNLIINSNYEGVMLDRFERINKDFNLVGQKAQFVSSITNPTTRIVNNMSYALLGLIGAFTILKGGLSVGLFTSFLSYSMMFSKPFNELSANMSQVFVAKAGIETIEALLNEKEQIDSGTISIDSLGKVDFDHVDFSYNKNKKLIKDLNLNVLPKQKIAIVGPTGSGKSTLINILMRFYEVDKGIITIDDVDITDMTRASLHNNISIVLQEPWLFEGTIFENIRYGNPEASKDAVIEAAKKADCHDMIMRLDKGYETLIAKGASNVSKGQMQLITIARALLIAGSILILDEATSSIDSLTEKRIQSVFTKIMKQHTSFFVAHRLSTVIDSDLILVMKEGSIIEKGNHKELLALNGFYKELYESQF